MAFDIAHEFRLATDHHQNGRLAEAESIYKRILFQEPGQPDALHLLGVLAAQSGQPAQAIAFIRRAIAAAPESVDFHINLGLILERQGNVKDAAASYANALVLKPLDPELHFKLANALRLLGSVYDAITHYRETLRLAPNNLGALNNLGNVYKHLHQYDDAVLCYRRALDQRPDDVTTLVNLGGTLQRLGQHTQAIELQRRAIALSPPNPSLHSNLLLALNYDPRSTRQSLFDEARTWSRLHESPLVPLIRPPNNDRNPDRPLRIGYISADFMDNPCAFFIKPLLAAHDRTRFELFIYSNVSKPDAITLSFHPLAHHWRDISPLSDDAAADLIRADRIDILVDLKLHTLGNRLLVLARKPAPVQVTWCGYPGTTGMSAIDYRLSDNYLDPPDAGFDAYYSEKTIRLPGCFWCYDAFSEEPAVATDGNHPLTFGCLNTYTKITGDMLALWARVLIALPGSRLMLSVPTGSSRTHVTETLAASGISGERLVFAEHAPRRLYLERYRQIDICLDTLPYNGHTTTIDALWMGVPVVTLVGNTPPGRGGVSILSNIDLSDLIATTPDDFVRIAVQLAADAPRRQYLRDTLRDRMRRSPLMNARDFASAVEQAYRTMWHAWCDKQS